MNGTILIFLVAGVVLLTAGGVSIYAGKTIGLYGAIETSSSIFYWIIVVTYIGLGVMCLITVVRLLLLTQ